MDKIYAKYADELKNALLSDNINRILIYGNDGRKIEYTRSSPIDLENLPSVQPEIIRCKDCKHSEGCFLWAENGIGVFNDGFCNYAERRIHEKD